MLRRQGVRLRRLKKKLTQTNLSDHEARTTDLFEVGNIIKMKENQVRLQLVQTFGLMDAALQYYYLLKPTPVKRYDTMAIQQGAVAHIQSSIAALQNFPSTPVDLSGPIEYNVPVVPVKDLLSADGYKVSIPLSSLPFRDYVRVRILRIEVRADNIERSSAKLLTFRPRRPGSRSKTETWVATPCLTPPRHHADRVPLRVQHKDGKHAWWFQPIFRLRFEIHSDDAIRWLDLPPAEGYLIIINNGHMSHVLACLFFFSRVKYSPFFILYFNTTSLSYILSTRSPRTKVFVSPPL